MLLTSSKPEFSCGIATFRVDGIDTAALADHLWDEHRILTVAIKHDEVDGIRVSPSVYTTPSEIDRFCDVVEAAIANGVRT